MSYPNAPDSNAMADAIVLIQQGMPSKLLTWATTPITASGSPQAVTVASTVGLSAGMQINVDVANPETVTITALTGSSFSAVFAKDHGQTGLAWTVGQGSLVYNTVKKGAITDPTDITTYCSITFHEGETERNTSSGWRVKACTTFLIESGFDMSNNTSAEQLLLTTRDVLLPVYAAKISLNNTPGVYCTLLDGEDKSAYKAYPNGRIYRIHQIHLKADHQYNVTLGP